MGRYGIAIILTVAGLAVVAGRPAALHGQGGDDRWRTDFTKHTVPLEEIVSGGPPKDGIPAIDEPRFQSVPAADRWLEPDEPVLVVERNGEAKAYPLQIMVWHEIVNDRIGGVPVAVTYCPLCNTGITFDRRHDGRVLSLGTTGRLRHSDMVMYDRQTESWWQQASGEGIVGAFAGDALEWIPTQTVSWSSFREAHPEGRVLSRETGYRRDYGRNPYVGYDLPGPGGGPFRQLLGDAETDDRLPAMERVAAVHVGGESVAFPFSRLRDVRVAHAEVAGRPIVVFWGPGTASPLQARSVAGGRDVGSTGVFDRRLGGRVLTFERHEDGFRDRQTGSDWNLLGQATHGPLAGEQLEPVELSRRGSWRRGAGSGVQATRRPRGRAGDGEPTTGCGARRPRGSPGIGACAAGRAGPSRPGHS